MNVTELSNQEFFLHLENKPKPQKLQEIKPLPKIKLELKNVVNLTNLEEKEKLDDIEIQQFIQQILMKDKDEILKPQSQEIEFTSGIYNMKIPKKLKIMGKAEDESKNEDEDQDKEKTRQRKTITKRKGSFLPEDDILPKEFIENMKQIYDTRETLDIDISPKYMYNKGLFQNSIMQILKQYQLYDAQKVNDETCNEREGVNENIFTPFNHQLLVKDYLNIASPYRGLILYHGLGSGKTCTSIGVIEGFKYDKKILILTPASLQKNYKTQLQHCGDKIYKSSNFWYFKEVMKNEGGLMRELHKLTGCPIKMMKKRGGLWLIDPTKKTNKDTLTKEQLQQIKDQILSCLENKYTFISYNGQLKLNKFFNNFTQGETINPFDHSVVVIDEAHNFISGIVNKFNKQNSISMKLYNLLMDAEDCRVILLTGTPIINYPNEVGVMMNILRGYIKTLEIKLQVLTNDKIDKSFFKKLFKRYPYVDYYDYKVVDFKANIGTLSITKNPFGFIHDYDEKGETDGLKLDETGNLTFVDFEKKIINIINKIPSPKDRSKKIFKVISKNVKNNKNLPDSFDEFQTQFIDPNENIIVNKEKLQRRIVGLVSHLGDKEKLMPEIIAENIVEVEMSDYQIPIYAEARRNEIKQEKQNRKKMKKNKILGELYTQTTSTYRIFSRAFCNFVFPKGIERPLPKREMMDVLETKNSVKQMDEDILDPVLDELHSMNLEGRYDDVAAEEKISESESNLYNQKIIRSLKELNNRKEELFSKESLHQFSPKFLAFLKNIENPYYSGSHLLYSQFRTLEGIGILKFVLEANGFVELKIRKTNIKPSNIETMDLDQFGIQSKNIIGETKYFIDVPKDKWHLPKFALYTGTESVEEKEYIRNIFNSDWESLPEPLLSQVKQMGKNNYNGEICKLLMITSSGAEGINLKNVRYVHILEPYWHPVRIEQVVGRARRICSHKDLPPELRNIETFLYLTKFSEEQKSKREYKEIIANDKNVTSDERLFEIMQQKMNINKSILDVLKETSIDCTINKKSKDQVCFRLPISDKSTYLTKPNFYERSGETKTVQEKKQYKKITHKNKKYLIYENDQIINFDAYNKDKTIKIVGEKFKDKDGKTKLKFFKS